MIYTVRDVVCDYGVYKIYFDKDGEQHEDLKLICNSRSNALLIAEIMRADLRNKKFDWIWMKKIGDIKAEIDKLTVYHTTKQGYELICKEDVFRCFNLILNGYRDIIEKYISKKEIER